MVRGLYGDDVSAEVGPEEKTQGLDDIGSFRLPPREAELGELLVWLQHDQVGPEYHSGGLLLVVVDLDSCIVGDSEGDDLCLVTLQTGTGTGWGGGRREGKERGHK